MFLPFLTRKNSAYRQVTHMNKKRLWLRILKITALLLPAVLLVTCFPTNVMDDSNRIRGFYLEPENSLDMVLIGSSENYAGYSPVLAYEEFGFTSYPYTLSGTDFDLFPYELEQVLRVQSPAVILVDIADIPHFKSDEGADAALRQFLAGIPLSSHKARIIRERGDPEQWLSYWLPFSVNHGSSTPEQVLDYVQSNMAQRRRGYSLLKGTLTFTGSGENWDGPWVDPISTAQDFSTVPLETEIQQRCHWILDICDGYPETEFVFINTPHRITAESSYIEYQQMNALGQIIESRGYDFINLETFTDEIGLVMETDFYNNRHMNLYGQYKTTRYLCGILTEEYGLHGRSQSPENKANWDACVDYQKKYFSLFEEQFRTRKEWEFGLWLQEDAWLLENLK